MSLEQYLLNEGFIPHKLEKIKGGTQWVPVKQYYFSTMGSCWIRFQKDQEWFAIGLSEKDKPVTLINPRPIRVLCDDQMNRILLKYPPDQIIKAIREGTFLDFS